MKNVLRMSLFIIARAGLCLAVVAWIVGQWWAIEIDNDQRDVHVRMDYRGWVIVDLLMITRAATEGWNFAVETAGRTIMLDVVELSQLASRIGGKVVEFPGLSYASMKDLNYLFLRHWLVTSLAAAFYLTLKFIYRRKPTVPAGGESDA